MIANPDLWRAGLLIASGALLAACSGGEEVAAPGASPADEEAAIADAAEMLEERQDAPETGEVADINGNE